MYCERERLVCTLPNVPRGISAALPNRRCLSCGKYARADFDRDRRRPRCRSPRPAPVLRIVSRFSGVRRSRRRTRGDRKYETIEAGRPVAEFRHAATGWTASSPGHFVDLSEPADGHADVAQIRTAGKLGSGRPASVWWSQKRMGSSSCLTRSGDRRSAGGQSKGVRREASCRLLDDEPGAGLAFDQGEYGGDTNFATSTSAAVTQVDAVHRTSRLGAVGSAGNG